MTANFLAREVSQNPYIRLTPEKPLAVSIFVGQHERKMVEATQITYLYFVETKSLSYDLPAIKLIFNLSYDALEIHYYSWSLQNQRLNLT